MCLPHRPFQPSCVLRRYLSVANYTELYMLAAWEPHRYSIQMLHEFDPCCYAGHDRHAGILQYNAAVSQRLGAAGSHGGFSTAISDWNVHAVCPMDKLILKSALRQTQLPQPDFNHLPCDILRTANSTPCPFAPPPRQTPEAFNSSITINGITPNAGQQVVETSPPRVKTDDATGDEAAGCKLLPGRDYSDAAGPQLNASSAPHCCSLCASDPGCAVAVYTLRNKQCFTKLGANAPIDR